MGKGRIWKPKRRSSKPFSLSFFWEGGAQNRKNSEDLESERERNRERGRGGKESCRHVSVLMIGFLSYKYKHMCETSPRSRAAVLLTPQQVPLPLCLHAQLSSLTCEQILGLCIVESVWLTSLFFFFFLVRETTRGRRRRRRRGQKI